MISLPTSNTFLIVTPTLGRSSYLSETLDSVYRIPASLQWSHSIVCPPALTTELKDRFPRSRVLPETSHTMYAAINDAAEEHDEWTWLTYINDDDFFYPDVSLVMRRITSLMDSAFPTVVYSKVHYVTAVGRAICEFPIQRDPTLLAACYRIACNPLATHGTFINRAAYELLGGFDGKFRYVGDMDFFVRALNSGVRFQYVPVLTSAFRLHGDNLTTHTDAFRAEEDMVRARLPVRVGHLQARLLRLSFVAQNWRSYWQRGLSVRTMRMNDYLDRLTRGSST